VLLVLSGALTLWAGRGTTFYANEYRFLVESVHSTSDTVLAPAVGHLAALLILSYHGLFATVGLGDYWAYRLISTLLHLACCLVIFAYARRRVGAGGGLLAAAPILFLGTGADDFLTLQQAGALGSLTLGLAALLAFDRGPRWDALALVLLLAAVAWDSEGVILAGALGLEIVLSPKRRRRAWVAIVPLGAYAAWVVGYQLGDPRSSPGISTPTDLLRAAGYVFDAAVGAVAGLAGVQLSSPTLRRDVSWLPTVASVLAVLGALGLASRLPRRRPSPRVVMLGATLLGYWAVLSVARGSVHGGYANRYVFVGAVLLVLLAAEVGRGVTLGGRSRRVLAALVVVSVVLNAGWLVVDGRFKRHESTIARAELGALEIARDQVAPGFQPDANIRLLDVRAAPYFAATRKYRSSPADSPAQLAAAPEGARAAADDVLVRGLRAGPVPASMPAGGRVRAPELEAAAGADVLRSRSCLRFRPRGASLARAEVRLPAAGVIVTPAPGGGVQMFLRRFGPFPPSPAGVSVAATFLRAPLGRAATPWHARLVFSGPLAVC
jgi:hypothetical protein